MPDDARLRDRRVSADQVQPRVGVLLSDPLESREHGGAVLSLPVNADEQVARPAPVAWRRLAGVMVLSEPDREDPLGRDPVAADDALGDPVRGAAAGDGRLVHPALTIDIAPHVAVGQPLQVGPRIGLARLQHRRVLERDDVVAARQQHVAGALDDRVESARGREPVAHKHSARRGGRPREQGRRVRAPDRAAQVAAIARPDSRGDAAQVCRARHHWRELAAQRDDPSDHLAHRLHERRRGSRAGDRVRRVDPIGDGDRQRAGRAHGLQE